MMYPWHGHGYTHKTVARDGRPLGAGSVDCDTFGVKPGERIDAIIECDRVGVWVYHRHILPHVEGLDGVFGMDTTLIVVPAKEDVETILRAVADQYTPA